ncbi:hypothetical protein BJ166DRAFT_105015 [Pestalotiopsis sp. NC0098]|nr:hypothetical protein BJ166DRAFT_105015 [Pestalotiopsis sp. NC0098]
MPHRDMALAPRATWRPYPERGPCRCSRYLLHAAPALPAPLPSLSSHENANLKAPAESRLQSVTGGFRSVYFSSARLCAKLEVNGPRLSKSTISLLLVLGHVLQRRNTHYTFCTTHFNFTGFELCPGEPRTLGQGHSLRDAAGYRLSSKDTSAHPILRKLPDLELLCKKNTTRRTVIGVSSGRAYLYTTAPFNCPSSASLSQLRKCLDRERRST